MVAPLRAPLVCWFLPGMAALTTPWLVAAPWIAITEVHFHPPGDATTAAAGEFIEILSREAPRANLSRWKLEGDVDFEFPDGVTILPGEYLVVARDPRRFVADHPDVGRVFGPFTGALDNAGGQLRLLNAAGGIASEARWEIKRPWPASTCGAGHTLSILDPLLDPLRPSSWAPSRRLGGTPGHPNFPVAPPSGERLIAKGALWRWASGLPPPDSRWNQPSFDDSAWTQGPSGFGYGDDDDATEIDDMSGRYWTLYTRHELMVADLEKLQRLVLSVDYDDGFVAYLNGREVARANLGEPLAEVRPDQAADTRHEAGAPVEFDLGMARENLKVGRNVLAVEVHNDNLASSDLSLIVELLNRQAATTDPARFEARINEFHTDPTAPFVELFNANSVALNLGGTWISDDPQNLKKLQLPPDFHLPARGLVALTRQQLGESFVLARATDFVALTSAKGDRVIDAIQLDRGNKTVGMNAPVETPSTSAPPDPITLPRGRHPDGGPELVVLSEPTPGQPNRARAPVGLVINEIHYHAPASRSDEAFVEIHNAGPGATSLKGFKLTRAVRFAFPDEATIPPGGYLVVARNPDALGERHGLDRSKVFGPYVGNLSGKAEEIVLRDDWGNAVDRVAYADRAPWPRWADGLGSSLELVDPTLDNSLAQAWAASDESVEGEWDTFTIKKKHQSFQGRNYAELQFILLDEGECLIDDVEVAGGMLSETFETSADGWSALGNHDASGRQPGAAAQGVGAYRIVASGRGNPRHNYVSRSLPRGLRPGREYTIQFRARWRRGSSTLLVRTPGQGIAQACELRLPTRSGTPCAQNSRRTPQAAVALGPPTLEPVFPNLGQSVRVEVQISSSSPVATATVHYQPRQTSQWRRLPLRDDGKTPDDVEADGLWTALIPGVSSDAVSFYVVARNAAGRQASFPPAGATAPAMYPVGARTTQRLPSYTILVPDSQWRTLEERPRMSNQPLNATLVYNDWRIFYDVKLRLRGSPFTRSDSNWRVIFGADNLDGRSTLTLDGQGGDGRRPNERLTYWLINELEGPTPRQQYVRVSMPGREAERIYEDVEKVDERFCARWFPPQGDAGGFLHKIDDHWELSTDGDQVYHEADFSRNTRGVEHYRWNFPPRGASLDLENVASLITFLDPNATSNETFDNLVASRVDADEWIRVLAARAIADDWDTMGRARGKNAFLYQPRGSTRWQLIPWDCDLAWDQNPEAPLLTGRFGGIDRLLERPQHWRKYLACLWYLAERSLGADRLDVALADLEAQGKNGLASYRSFALQRREFMQSQLANRTSFQVTSSDRMPRQDGPDVLRLAGIAPPHVLWLRLAGRDTAILPEGEERWTAELPVGPEGGPQQLQALDFGRQEIAAATLSLVPREEARPLPPVSEVLELRGKNVPRRVPEPTTRAAPATKITVPPPARLPPQRVRARPRVPPPPAPQAPWVARALPLTGTALALSLLLVWLRRRSSP